MYYNSTRFLSLQYSERALVGFADVNRSLQRITPERAMYNNWMMFDVASDLGKEKEWGDVQTLRLK